MKNPSLFQYSIGFFLISILLCLYGCTVIGLFIGNSIDENNKKEKEVQISGWEINKISKNESITFFLKNGDSFTDNYVGSLSKSEEEYKKDYESSYLVLNQNTILPILGDTIELTLSNSTNSSVRLPFSRFDYNSVILMKGPSHLSSYLYKDIGTAKLKDDRLIDINQIQDLVKSCDLPSRNYILTKRAKINRCDVQYISYQEKETNGKSIGKTMGMIIGAGIDVTWMVIALNNMSFDYSGGSSSCPYIYSFDGSDYRLDSETFGGAIFKAAQRTEVDNLDYLKEYNGYHNLRLTNELDETQYVDEFKLLLVDHPTGTQVMPSFDGKLHVLKTLQSPESAIDKDGNNVLNLIKSKDDHIWISNPFTRNADIPGDGRDAMEVRFKKPANAKAVKLALNVQNTLWAASLQKEMLSLHGNKLQDWYHLMNTSEMERATFTKAMIREGMLLVQVWDGDQWQTRDFVWEVGPAIPKDQVVVLDLKDIPGNQLKIRLESTVGFWMINSIGADFSNDDRAEIQELTAETAIDHTGKDVTEILRHNDDMYLVMPTTEDKVDISFKAIPKNENSTRTYLIKCSGYYNIHTDETGEPKLSLLNKLVTEPGAYGQFVLKKLNQELNSAGIQ